MEWIGELRVLPGVLYAMALGGAIGYEREMKDRPAGFRTHYETAAARIAARLEEATAKGQMRDDGDLATEVRAWAIMGMNVFLGLRFGVWGRQDPDQVAAHANDLIARGLKP